MRSNIGRVIYGYCNGYFGRDHYTDCRVEAEGVDWIVVRPLDDPYGLAEFTSFKNEEEKQDKINEWSKESD